ncbi:hypothetical protein D3C85_1409700 [compost metagenome]
MEVLGDGLIEVAILCASGRGVGLQILAEFGYANGHARISVDVRLIAQEALFKPHLGLRSQVVMHACKHDDDFVAGVSGLADEP